MGKSTCESTPAIDIRAWAAEGYLESGRRWVANVIKGDEVAGAINVANQESAVVLTYSLRGKGGDNRLTERVEIDWTVPNLGGQRPWFLCPGCGHRRALLYGRGGRFRCR